MEVRTHLEHAGQWLFRWRSYLPLLFLIPLALDLRRFDWPLHSYRLQLVWEGCCLSVSLVGLALRIVTVGHVPQRTSGRNTARQVAETLNRSGVYSVMRHPLYVGNFLLWSGVALFFLNWQLLLIFVLGFALYYERIMAAEEQYLREKFGREFTTWAGQTPAIVPRWANWTPPELPFCWKSVLRREFHGFFGLILTFFLLDAVTTFQVTRQLRFSPAWTILLLGSLVLYMTLRTLKKRTRVLHVAGR